MGSPFGPPVGRVFMEVAMIRWTDLIGVAGFALVIISSLLFVPHSAPGNQWIYWLGVFALWLLGFAAVVGWVLTRWSIRYSKDSKAPLLIWTRRPVSRP